jgi:hypothetical protein
MNFYHLTIEINGIGFDFNLKADSEKEAKDLAWEKIREETKVIQVDCIKGESGFFGKLGRKVKTSLVL